jgi:hypothetical protein
LPTKRRIGASCASYPYFGIHANSYSFAELLALGGPWKAAIWQ